MPDNLRVHPDDLRITASRLDATASDFREAHDGAHTSMSATATSLADSATGAALAELLAHWKAETNAHHQHLLTHSENHINAAIMYTQIDSDSQDAITVAAEKIV